MENENEDDYLGIGWKFPPSFDYHNHAVEMVRGVEDVRESLMILMRTRVGERTMEVEYGCDLTPIAFQQLDLNLETLMINNIKQTIMEHEPRVDVLAVSLVPDHEEGAIDIHLTYKVKELDLEEKIQYSYHPMYNK
ncbi:MAG: GPW/gp25 family protein [Amoebophilaceae bacterium]|nr:GPW/gp25 family protein [Amoebophilaceae bacterium]